MWRAHRCVCMFVNTQSLTHTRTYTFSSHLLPACVEPWLWPPLSPSCSQLSTLPVWRQEIPVWEGLPHFPVARARACASDLLSMPTRYFLLFSLVHSSHTGRMDVWGPIDNVPGTYVPGEFQSELKKPQVDSRSRSTPTFFWPFLILF